MGKPEMKVEKLLQYGLYLFLIAIGTIIGIAIRQYHDIPMSETINIIDVAALITTIFLAVYIPEVLDRKLKVLRDKKRLIDSRIEELQYFYRKINRIVQEGKSQGRTSQEVQNMVDICKSRLSTIILLLEQAEMREALEKEIQNIVMLSEAHRRLFLDEQEKDGEKAVSLFMQNEERLYNEIDRATSLIILKLSDI